MEASVYEFRDLKLSIPPGEKQITEFSAGIIIISLLLSQEIISFTEIFKFLKKGVKKGNYPEEWLDIQPVREKCNIPVQG